MATYTDTASEFQRVFPEARATVLPYTNGVAPMSTQKPTSPDHVATLRQVMPRYIEAAASAIAALRDTIEEAAAAKSRGFLCWRRSAANSFSRSSSSAPSPAGTAAFGSGRLLPRSAASADFCDARGRAYIDGYSLENELPIVFIVPEGVVWCVSVLPWRVPRLVATSTSVPLAPSSVDARHTLAVDIRPSPTSPLVAPTVLGQQQAVRLHGDWEPGVTPLRIRQSDVDHLRAIRREVGHSAFGAAVGATTLAHRALVDLVTACLSPWPLLFPKVE